MDTGVRKMYAIISEGGRQYRGEEGQELDLDYRDEPKGTELKLDRVLAVSKDGALTVGKPVVAGASVTAEILGPTKGEKVFVQKFRKRKNARRRTGHRQIYTRVKITKIS